MAQKYGLRTFNNGLTAVNILLALYILLLPLLPFVSLWWQSATGSQPPLVKAEAAAVEIPKENIPKDNTLVIPRINLQQTIHEGQGIETLRKGVWRRPAAGTPETGSNTVLVGHRFSYSDPAVFFHLDKVRMGDLITVYWEGSAYRYKVNRITVVAPSETAVEAATDEPLLTIYTCTPLWSAKNRLVVQATLEGRS